MAEQRNLLVGYDLNNDFSQISCFNYKTSEPESICINSEEADYMIPTVIGVKNDSKDWVFGEDAIKLSQAGNAVVIDNLLSLIEQESEVELFGVKFQAVKLLEKFFRKSLQLLKKYFPTNSILKLVVTLKNCNDTIEAAVYQALDSLGLGKDRVDVQSHLQSYQYYALSQSKELWMNDIGLFELDENGLSYHQITINRKNPPYLVGMADKDLSEMLSYEMLTELNDSEKLGFTFSNIANNVLYKQVVSAIYITGKGFEGNWSDHALRELCSGRRVFKGQNLYTKGACYAAKELSGERKLEEFIFLNKDMIMYSFTIPGYYDAKSAEVLLVKPATPWYEIDDSMDIIIDEEKEIPIYIQNAMNNETNQISIALNGLPVRPNKMTRVQVRIKFADSETAVVTIKDKGFGEFYPSSNRIWEKEINMSSLGEM